MIVPDEKMRVKGEVIYGRRPSSLTEKLGLDFGPFDFKASALITFSLFLKFTHSFNKYFLNISCGQGTIYNAECNLGCEKKREY